jgi:hypothetical protein
MSWQGIKPGPSRWDGGEHSRKEPFEELVISYSEHLQTTYKRATTENARDIVINKLR